MRFGTEEEVSRKVSKEGVKIYKILDDDISYGEKVDVEELRVYSESDLYKFIDTNGNLSYYQLIEDIMEDYYIES